KDNQSYIFEDAYPDNVDHFITGLEEAVSINLWATAETPAILGKPCDPTKSGLPFLPSEHGTVFRICDIPPDSSWLHRLDDILLNNKKISAKQKKMKHPLMHKV